jgi:hypothetical protein
MVKIKTTVHKYHRNDGTPVRQHKRNIDVDLYKKAEKMAEEGYDDSEIVQETGYHVDEDLVQSKEDKESDEMSEMENYEEEKQSSDNMANILALQRHKEKKKEEELSTVPGKHAEKGDFDSQGRNLINPNAKPFYPENTKTKQLKKDIEKYKNNLILKAKKKGLYENFGDKEVRALKDKYPTGYMGAERENMDLIQEFNKWAMSVDDRSLK